MGKTIDELIENTKKNSIENALFNIVVQPDCEEELDKESFDKIYDNCQIEIQYLSRYGKCVCSDIFHKCRFKSMDDLNDYFLCNSKSKIITFEYKRKDIQWNEFLLLDVNGVTKDEIDTSQKV